MRHQGEITDWKDDLGYGFVAPNGGGQKVFVHIKQFSKASPRPINGDLITYELSTDQKKRTFAKNIAFVRRRIIQNSLNKNSTLGVKFSVIFLAILALTVLVGKTPLAILMIYLALSTITFINYALDKSAAKNSRQRTPESQLHLLSLLGGWPGATVAQSILRHKSVKKEFQAIFCVTIIINCAVITWLMYSQSGARFISALVGA